MQALLWAMATALVSFILVVIFFSEKITLSKLSGMALVISGIFLLK